LVAKSIQGYRLGEGHQHAKVSDELVAKIISEFIPHVMGYKKLAKKYGDQFKPNKLLVAMAKNDEKFYVRFNPEKQADKAA